MESGRMVLDSFGVATVKDGRCWKMWLVNGGGGCDCKKGETEKYCIYLKNGSQ